MKLLVQGFYLVLLTCLSLVANAASYWEDAESFSLRTDQPLMAKASQARYLRANIDSIRQQLLAADNVDIELPLPNGETAIYHFEYSPIAEQGLLDKYPDIRTFRGVDVSNSTNRGRFDISPAGFRGMFRHNGETIFIDPQYVGDASNYISYSARDAEPLSARPVDQVLYSDLLKTVENTAKRNLAKGSSDGNLRIYRLAVAATAEYTQFFGGTVANSLAAIITAINRVNEIYENDLGVRLLLVANNNSIIYTNAATDPYLNDGFNDLGLNQTNIDNVIGAANYDIGHLFGTGSGGIAALGSVCNSSFKARGLTGLNNPTGDSFYIDFVAHEIGHQFGANHTFNGTAGSCSGGNRNPSTAFEPGSGSTIMAYAGICGAENLQGNSDPYFHAGSIAEITAFIQNSGTGGSCADVSNSLNATPNASAGADVTIPVNTPFVLTGSATDADVGDALSYVWEQLDAGTASSSQAEWVDDGSRAIFRSLEPTTSPVRYFPNLPDVLDGSITAGEAFPTTNRDLNFRFTVRDGSGETAFENKVVTVTASAGPFEVISPGVGDVWASGTNIVSWNVANTNGSPVSCLNVSISLSSDNGGAFVYTLESMTPNDGSETVTVPAVDTSNARVMVNCVDNVFYAVSDSQFDISATAVAVSSIDSAQADEGGTLNFVVRLASALVTSGEYSFGLSNNTTTDADIGSVSFTNGVTNNSGVLTVPSGVSEFGVQVGVTADTIVESDETLTLYLGGLSAVGTLSDVNSSIDAITNSEPGTEGGSLSFIISLTAPTVNQQNFTLTLTPVTASESDYGDIVLPSGFSLMSNDLTVPSGISSFTLSVPIVDDSLVEGIESVRLSIDSVSSLGSIVDNDTAGGTPNTSPPSDDSDDDEGSTGASTGGFILILMSLLLVAAGRWRL